MPSIKDITLVIVSYYSYEIIKKKLPILSKINTIVIDNANEQKLKNILKDFNKIEYYNFNQNVGFAKANNFGARKVKTKYLFICNPDITFEINDLVCLAEKFETYSNLGIAGPALYEQNARCRNSSIKVTKKYHRRNFLEKKNYYNLEHRYPSGDFCADYMIGCSMMFETIFFNQKLNGFCEDFFIFYEDNDICDRTNNLKKSVIECPDIKMIHDKNTSGKYSLFHKLKMGFHHKLSEYIYLKKNILKIKLYKIIFINFLDYFQRFFINILIFRYKNALKNFVRILSIFYFVFFIK